MRLVTEGIAYLGFKTVQDVDNCTLHDYALLQEAYALKRVEQERVLHEQAFLNQLVKSTKDQNGTPRYQTFKDFYDYDRAVAEVKHAFEGAPISPSKTISDAPGEIIAKRIKRFRELKRAGKIIPISQRKGVKHNEWFFS